ncbi:hypothetical protein B0H14DRAFT_3855611 [Mycena olivaceomarginata]|nr:hypothetical protein B0H14DRAFT_3855611 [Mycena olivaceomarginata]
MASTATSTPHMSAPVVLPSIHEMFPEHLMPRARPPASSRLSLSPKSLRPAPVFHIASSRPHRRQPLPLPAVRTQPRSRAQSASSSSSDGDDMEVDGEEGEEGEDGEGQGAEEGKKHVCPTCAKRFKPAEQSANPRQHTHRRDPHNPGIPFPFPFRCPHPSCGRAFNVNSNMRRHYRNHASGALAPAFSAGVARFCVGGGIARLARLTTMGPHLTLVSVVCIVNIIALLPAHPRTPRTIPPAAARLAPRPWEGHTDAHCRAQVAVAVVRVETYTYTRTLSHSTPTAKPTPPPLCSALLAIHHQSTQKPTIHAPFVVSV